MSAIREISKNQFFGLILMFGVIFLSPFYFYASGMPQPAHILMLIASMAVVFINRGNCFGLIKANVFLIAFLVLVFLINIIYFIQFNKTIFIVNSLYWLYGLILLLAVICVSCDDWVLNWVKRFVLLQLTLILICYLMSWGGFLFWPRYQYFFNGPNQLAYYVLSMLIVYSVIDRGNVERGLLFAYFLTTSAIIMTGARSMFIAFLPMIFILLYIARCNLRKQIFILLIPVILYYLFIQMGLPWYIPTDAEKLAGQNFNIGSNTLNRFRELCVSCNSTDYYSIEYQLRARGYLRILDFPEYLFWGAGHGMDERFGALDGHAYEIHSSLGGVLFYYGIVGLAAFLIAVYKIFKNKINILFLAPIFAYGLFTYGLRSPYFWFVLGFVASSPNLFNIVKKDNDWNASK